MNEDENMPEPTPPDSQDKTMLKFMWLLVAFLPSLVGLMAIRRNVGQPAWLFAVDLSCSVIASIGLMKNSSEPVMRIFWMLFLSAFFFVLNVGIVLFIGCAGMGRIAP